MTTDLGPGGKGKFSFVSNNLANYGSAVEPGGQTKRYSEIKWAGTDATIAGALEDFRRLGALDLALNHPDIAP